ncbi:glycosyltransferase family 2 protein [Castellaniella defragrans]|uniref:glycosyltransferase family 2 protein n=1 Tax=Castellaniella defragrans TaxID=75697 RepID=UPI002AFF6D7D|nr:glycosyltransferase family 2 protein [Castellaniella defragrans]
MLRRLPACRSTSAAWPMGRHPQAGAFLDWWAAQLLHLPLQMQQLAGQAPDEFPGAALPSWVPDCRMLPVGAPWLTWASDAGLRQQAEQSLPAARPYSFACYADGQPIDPAERLAYASFNDPDREAIVDPFDPATLVRLAAYREIDAASGSAAGLLYQVWRERDTVLRLQDQTQKLQDQAQQLQARLQEAQTHLAVLQGSRSYRLGRLLLAPLRLARSKGGGRLLQALRHMLARLRCHQRQHGWRATLGASVRYLRRKGWSGLRRDLALDLDPLSPLSGQWLRPDPPPLAAHEESVDVIVCIHNAPDDVRRCLAAVLEHTVQPYRLILVDDGSQPKTAGLVSEFAAAHGIDPIRNETARGYTLAANQGLRASEADFAVLLNSDTIVTPDWLDRMLRCARSDARVAVVGPLSNTASWQSVPRIVGDDGDWCDNPLPDGRTPADMAGQVARVARPQYPRVGFRNRFCYMIRRVAREELGNFDEYTFARGFGEENDYSLRVLQAGWQLAVADDAYVFHAQSRSYSSERRHKLARLAGEALEKKHGQARIEQGLLHTRDNLVLAAMRARIAGCGTNRLLSSRPSSGTGAAGCCFCCLS